MLISAIIISFIALIYALVRYHNKILYCIALEFISIMGMTIIAILYSSKLGTVDLPLKIDRSLYALMANINFHISDIVQVYSLCFILFMLSNAFIALCVSKPNWVVLLITLIPLYVFSMLNTFSIRFNIYTYVAKGSAFAIYLDKIQNSFFQSIPILYMILPFLPLFKYYRKTKLNIAKLRTVILGFCLVCVDLYFYFVFMAGPFHYLFFSNIDFIGYPRSTHFKTYNLTPTMLFFIFMSIFIIMLLVQFKPFNELVFGYRRELKHIRRLLNKDICMLLHTYKNAFISIDKLTEIERTHISKGDMSKLEECIGISSSIAHEQLSMIDRTLSMLKRFPDMSCKVDVISCIKKAIKIINFNENIKTTFNYSEEIIPVYGNENYLTEVFVNIFDNAVEAMEKNRQKEPHIEINVENDFDYCIVTVTDNGIGIEKSDLTKVFQPFYSKKTYAKGAGVGLSYIKKIITQYKGEVTLKSEVGKYTQVRLVLISCPDERRMNKWMKLK